MGQFNPAGTLFVVLLLIPNIVYAFSRKCTEKPAYSNKILEVLEQTGRYGCMALMVWNLGSRAPGAAYLALGAGILGLYWLGWAVFWRENSLRKALSLSVLPTLLFLESGAATGSLPLILAALLFGASHIAISVKSV